MTKGKGYFGKKINIYVLKENDTINKIGIAVGKKFAKAVKRNKLKRWIRESYYCYESSLKAYYKIIFVLKKNVKIEELDFEKIKYDIEILFKKAGIIK